MGRAFATLLAAVVAIGLFAWSARAGDGTTVEERLAKVEQRLTAIEARLKTLPATGGTAAAPPATAPAPPPGADEKQDVLVYATASGTKYHRAGCSYLRSSSIPMKLSEAKAKGLTPCSRCGPP